MAVVAICRLDMEDLQLHTCAMSRHISPGSHQPPQTIILDVSSDQESAWHNTSPHGCLGMTWKADSCSSKGTHLTSAQCYIHMLVEC